MSENFYDFKPVRMHQKVGATLRIDVCRQLEELAEITGANRSAVIAMAITNFYAQTKKMRGEAVEQVK